MKLKEFYDANNYAVIRQVANPQLLKNLPDLYTEGHEEYDYRTESGPTMYSDERQVSGTYSRTNYPPYKSLHRELKPVLENVLERRLIPTYYFDRVYYAGTELVPHKDWEGCEVSVTLQIETTLEKPWDFYVEGTPLKLNNGDAVIYNGMDAEHWREPMPGGKLDYHHQIFLHYVAHNSPYYFVMFENGWELNDY